ncbi:hypothetical protein RA27_12655 [Ruegeria sp. ANG-R]|uniref:DUF1636 family protein n=1 Tax=Ruegeria sp. ANG-R TaxID=1577903 RepID=UPI000580AC60|nr:DUF1636 domain-containing protein [Ruegeria sp. ANG-R]KIC40616.1 hypothetical protein RA27_12655 [Ruegeria sp. ANG-R]
MTKKHDHFLLVCSNCRGSDSTDLAIRTLAGRLPDGFAIRMVNCMAGCDRPTTIGFQAPGKAQYLFGDIATHEDLDAVVEFAEQYLRCADGWTNATDRPQALFTKTLSRMPRIEQGVSL